MEVAEGSGLVMYYAELLVGGLYLAQVQHPHVHVLRAEVRTDTDNPETKDAGSGIYS